MRVGLTPIWLLLWLAVGTARAVTVGGMVLPAERDGLKLHGAGLLRKGLIFRIYVGALYLEREEDAGNVLSRVPKRLDIHYFHETPKRHMVRVAEETLKRNLSADRYETHKKQIASLHKAYRDGRKGGYASLCYKPHAGLTYSVDGDKQFHVSPFNTMKGRYAFTFSSPGDEMRITIRLIRDGNTVMDAAVWGSGRPLTTGNLWKALLVHPLTTVMTMPRILWQAAILHYRKKPAMFKRPEPVNPMTIRVRS